MTAREDYFRANTAIAQAFFDGRFAGQPVYLSLDNDTRAALATSSSVPPDEVEDHICDAVRRFLSPLGNPYSCIEPDMKAWHAGGMNEAPPCIAILFCLSHAATIMASEGDFASNNYYLRLGQLTNLDRRTLSGNRHSTDRLWSALADWMLKNNHALGRPTARGRSTWRYVGMAISQAVVRAADRPYFHDLFERFGLSGSEDLSTGEMLQYLSHWITSAGASQRLRAVWRKSELRERVAEAAIAELAAWNNITNVGEDCAQSRIARLSLVANLVPRFPRTLLELHLGRLGEADTSTTYTFGDSQETFYFANETFGAVTTITPPVLDEGGLLQAYQFTPRGHGGSARLSWSSRLIIPMAIHPQANLWMEVNRAAFGVPHVVLVRNANSLPAKATPEQLPGLPEGWVLYQDVRLINETEPAHRELECLVPMSNDGLLSIAQGLQLLPNFFHAGWKPLANFVAAKGPTSIRLAVPGEENAAALASATSDTGECALEIDPTHKDVAGAVSLEARQGGNAPVSKEIFFRDANAPHPVASGAGGWLCYRSVTSAEPAPWRGQCAVEGLVAHGELPALIGRQESHPSGIPEGASEDRQTSHLAAPLAAHGARQVCVERGYHVMRYPMISKSAKAGTPFEGICNDCRRRDIAIYRARSGAARAPQSLPQLRPLKAPEQAQAEPVDYDILLDALSFLGRGTWAKFQALLEYWDGPERHPREVARELFLLGFLDLEVRPGTNSIRAWCVPQASINFNGPDTAYLSGFRSKDLLVALETVTRRLNGELVVRSIPGRPALVQLQCLQVATAAVAMEGMRDPLGRAVLVNTEPAQRLARACLALEGIEACLRPVSLARSKDLQYLDLQRMKWIPTDNTGRTGAYRWNHGIQLYALVRAQGDAVTGPYQVIKLLAAKQAGMQLHQYNRSAGAFLSTLGCEPPGLLERALVAASGELPAIGRGIVSYKSVSSEVAAAILSTMYPEIRAEHEASKSYQRI